MVDHAGWDVWEGESDADRVWGRYFGLLAEAARSGLFDILGHPDLVKMWGGERPWPERDPRFHYEPAVEAIAEAGIAVEVSTAGLRKPVGEMYPSRELCEMCVDAGAAFAISSDAHAPEQVGYEYRRATDMLRDLGVGEICVFEGRRRRLEPLG
jgi:histidinol-phosphatase (PHP family)